MVMRREITKWVMADGATHTTGLRRIDIVDVRTGMGADGRIGLRIRQD